MSDAIEVFVDPFTHFDAWFAAAREVDPQPEAASLATADDASHASNRVLLVRRWSARGFELQTNRQSRKGRELQAQPWAALAWHWKPLGRQVRAAGPVAWLPDEESDDYWRTRPRGSQLSAWASEQSEPTEGRDDLLARRAEVERRFAGVSDIPRPPHWGGILVQPLRVEFWQHEDDRLHQRLEYVRETLGAPWRTRWLQP